MREIRISVLRADLAQAVLDIYGNHAENCVGGCDCEARATRTEEGISALLDLAAAADFFLTVWPTVKAPAKKRRLVLAAAADRFDFDEPA